jgi:hypothetical protein
VVKPALQPSFDYRRLAWSEAASEIAPRPPAIALDRSP